MLRNDDQLAAAAGQLEQALPALLAGAAGVAGVAGVAGDSGLLGLLSPFFESPPFETLA